MHPTCTPPEPQNTTRIISELFPLSISIYFIVNAAASDSHLSQPCSNCSAAFECVLCRRPTSIIHLLPFLQWTQSPFNSTYGVQVCPSTGRPCDCSDGQVINSSEDKQIMAELKHEKPPQEPIFPPELRKRQPSELCLPGPLTTWHRSAFHVHQLAEACTCLLAG